MSVHFPTHQLPDSWFAVVTDVYNRELDRASKSPKQRTTVNGIAGNGTSTPSYIQYYDNLKYCSYYKLSRAATFDQSSLDMPTLFGLCDRHGR